MKLLILGFDAVTPEYIYGKSEMFPNLSRLKKSGVYSAYSAYVQKGYYGSYLSEMNWSSIYTGLHPWVHNITAKEIDGQRYTPEMGWFKNLQPFWEILNHNGYKVGMWSADCCVHPVEIDGYVVASKYNMIENKAENRRSEREIQVCEKDRPLLECLPGNPPPRLYPKMLSQQGYRYEELKNDSDLAWKAVQEYHFQESVDNFQEELDFYFAAMQNAQNKYPVDVMFFYTPTTDLIAHGCMCSDDNDVLIKTYQVLDKKVGELIDELKPDNVIVMSDHGMMNFKDIVECSDEKIRHEAFGARDEVLWLKNRYIAFEAHNGALLFTAHALKGTFIAAGKDLRHTRLEEMRTVDIYPTILELCGCKVSDEREGYVLDIFNRPCVNDKVLNQENIKYKPIAVIQAHDPNITDIIINEIYLHNRFCDITVVGDKRYKEIFCNNPRVTNFVSFSEYNEGLYEEVYCGYHNTMTGEMCHIRIR